MPQLLQTLTATATILTGQGVLAPTTALGIVTSSGKLKVVNSANTDGSQTLAAILLQGVDTTSSDVNAKVAIASVFLPKAGITFGGSDLPSTHFNSIGQAKSGVSIFVY